MRITLLLFVLLLPVSLWAQVPYWNWVQPLGGPQNDIARNVVMDASGRAYVAGYFQGTAQFDAQSFTSRTPNDIFLACFEPNGDLLWLQQAGRTQNEDWRVGLNITEDGGLLLTGGFYGNAVFGTETLTSRGRNDLFIARYDLSGGFEWVKQYGGRIEDWGKGIVSAPNGDFYLTGGFYDTLRFENIMLVSTGQNDVFVACFDPQGSIRWAQRAGGADFDEGLGITIDEENNVYICGSYGAKADFGPFEIESAAFFDFFIAKYSEQGRPLWVQSGQGAFTNFARQIQFDANTGDLYVCGSFSGETDFLGSNISSGGLQDGFVARITPDADLVWVRQLSSREAVEVYDLNFGSNNRMYVAGSFRLTASFGDTTLVSAGETDIYAAALNTDGQVLWAHRAGGPNRDRAYGIISDGLEAQYVVGDVGANHLWDGRNEAQFGQTDAFLAQLGQVFLTVNAGTDTLICSDAPAVLQGAVSFPLAEYSWSPVIGLDDPNELQAAARPSETITYTLSARFGALVASDVVEVRAGVPLERPWVFRRVNQGFTGLFLFAPRGGERPLRYRMDGGPWQNSSQFRDVLPGTYTLEIEDSLGCPLGLEVVMD